MRKEIEQLLWEGTEADKIHTWTPTFVLRGFLRGCTNDEQTVGMTRESNESNYFRQNERIPFCLPDGVRKMALKRVSMNATSVVSNGRIVLIFPYRERRREPM